MTVPASDIGSLRELLPDLVREVWLTDGSIVVVDHRRRHREHPRQAGESGTTASSASRSASTSSPTFHPVVRALVAALNGYVAERGGRFTSVSVTPEGLTVTAEREASE